MWQMLKGFGEAIENIMLPVTLVNTTGLMIGQ